jgi:hypothetical protein
VHAFGSVVLKDRYGDQRGGSEWEPTKNLLEGDGNSNKTNKASNTRLRLTTQVGQAHTATKVLLDLGTNKQTSEPKHPNTHNGNLHGLLPAAPVRPMAYAGQTGDTSQTGGQSRSGRWLQQPHHKRSRKPKWLL